MGTCLNRGRLRISSFEAVNVGHSYVEEDDRKIALENTPQRPCARKAPGRVLHPY